MELGAHVWLRRESSHWGWVPAVISRKEPFVVNGVELMKLTLKDDPQLEVTMPPPQMARFSRSEMRRVGSTAAAASDYYDGFEKFEVEITVDPEQLKLADHDDIKLRNLPNSYQLSGDDPEAGVISSPSTRLDDSVVGGVDDLIGLTHLHEPAILHALQLRYDADIIYTATGPILIAVNPFKPMPFYSEDMMERYRVQGEYGVGSSNTSKNAFNTPVKVRRSPQEKLPPHVYQTADDAYRAMMRGMENSVLMNKSQKILRRGESQIMAMQFGSPTNQSILVSGESGAGKTVTTKIVLNYFAMLSRQRSDHDGRGSPSRSITPNSTMDDVSIEQQVLQSNPILESFGNARTIRNDNSSRFGKYIDIRFTRDGKLSGASIDTYLLEKVRLIHQSKGERNYHVFYQFLLSASPAEREDLHLQNKTMQDFRMLTESGTFDRRDGVSDVKNHQEMLGAMFTIGFTPETVQSLMRLVVAVLFAGNMTFTPSRDGESCKLEETDAALCCADLLGITFEGLAAALTGRQILAGDEIVHKPLIIEEAVKATEALIKAVYGAAFDYIVEKINLSILEDRSLQSSASIGVLDIFGFETFDSNNFEQLCINYTNEALQQQFNRYVFKLEQQEYEKEGIMWKFISFPDNQDVLDLIDQKHLGILALLDEQCILPKSNDEKFTRYLYARCDKHPRFHATSAQRVDYKFSIEHYAGLVEYTTDSWLEKNKDQLPAASSDLITSSDFDFISQIQKYVRSEDRAGRGTVATKSVSSQFSTQLRSLRAKIDTTVPHYIRCLKPNDDLLPDYFEPKNIVEQLRCGGVLEAVRVSRAGYPTRYPHDVFMARYYILGDPGDKAPQSPLFSPTTQSDRLVDLKRLISKIAFDLWEADHLIMEALLDHEKRISLVNSPKHARPSKDAKKKIVTGPAAHNAPPFNLVVESSVMTPEEKQKKKQKKDPSAALLERREKHNVARPTSEKEFRELDFASRCAVAGLQLGRTKVFLRREAFDRIEGLRSEKFFSAATSIQKIIRGRIWRKLFVSVREAAIVVQSAIRMRLSRNSVHRRRLVFSAIKIQSAWRRFIAILDVNEIIAARRTAAVIIQHGFRDYKYRLSRVFEAEQEPVVEELGITEEEIIYAVTAVQAMYRGGRARSELLRAMEEVVEEEPPVLEVVPAPVRAPSPVIERRITPLKVESEIVVINTEIQANLVREIQEENWAMVENILDKHPELAEAADLKSGELPLHMIARHNGAWTLLIDMVLVLFPKALIHRDNMGALPIHHASAHDNLAALEIIYSAYKEGINDTDKKGRLPIHVAAEFDAVDAVKFLLSKSPEGAYTMVYRPPSNSGGGLPLHIACRNYASIGVITALLAENFASAKRTDENGDLPLHLLLRCGEVVDQVVVKTLLTCFSAAVSRTDMFGDLPLAISIKHQCRPAVINTILMQFPDAAGVLNGEGHSPLFLAFKHNADDRTILGLLNHAPELATAVDKKTGLLPIQVATENEHSPFIVHNLLKRDMPIDLREKIRAQLLPHHYSWNHVVSNTDDMYHPVVTKVLQSCTQPQVLALAHVEGPDGKIALAAATPVCKHEMRVMLRLFNTLEVVNQRPAYTNPVSDTQIFYALRYDPPPQQNGAFVILHEDKNENGENDYVEDWDDTSQVSGVSRNSIRSTLTSRSQQTIEDKLRYIRKEKGQQVIAKLTSRSDVVERELKVRKDFHLSRHYVPAIISVHHTVQHAAYSEAMAEPGYCITMEGADTTAENLMLDMRKTGKQFPIKALKRMGISLLHMHEHGLIHGDFGTHNIGKFGSRWKLLGIGGSVAMGDPTDPNRGFYHPPESIVVDHRRVPIGKKNVSASVVSIPALTTYDIWAYGVVVYEAVARVPLSPYACRGKRAMSSAEISKIGLWDENSVRKALKHVPEEDVARDLVKRLLHHSPDHRFASMRHVLEHPFFTGESLNDSKETPDASDIAATDSHPNSSHHRPAGPTVSSHRVPPRSSGAQQTSNGPHRSSDGKRASDMGEENHENGVMKSNPIRLSSTSDTSSPSVPTSPASTDSRRSARSFNGLRKIRSTFRTRQPSN